jgi:hypothetical protein
MPPAAGAGQASLTATVTVTAVTVIAVTCASPGITEIPTVGIAAIEF